MDEAVGQVKVSERGQMSLPARARHRWHLESGGELAWLDLGDAVVLIPGTVDQVRSGLLGLLDAGDWARAAEGFGDPELANQ